MAPVQSIFATQDHIITNVIDLFIIVLSGFNVDVGEGKVPAWLGL